MRQIQLGNAGLTVMRELASHCFGKWNVEWPKSVPEDQRPDPGAGFAWGFVCDLGRNPGRMGRRFARADVSITAAEFTEQGQPVPYTGSSDVELVLEEAAQRTEGSPLVEYALTRDNLGGLVPHLDFSVGDVVPISVWGKTLELPVTKISADSKPGAVLDWQVQVGGALISDDTGLEKANLQLRRLVAQERREREENLSKVENRVSTVAHAASAADGKAQAAESRARVAASAASTADSKAETADAKARAAKERAEEAIRRWRAAKDEADARHDELIAKNKELVAELDRRTVGMVHVRHDRRAKSLVHGVGIVMPQSNYFLTLLLRPGFVGSVNIDVYYNTGVVRPFAYDSTDFDLIEDWRGWRDRDPLFDDMAVDNRMLTKRVELPLGNVLAARVLIDHVVWNRN